MTGTPRRVGRPGGSSVPVQQTLSEARVRRCREIPCGTGVNGCYENFHIHTVKPEAPRRVQRVGRPRAFDAGGSATGGAFTAHIGGLRSDSGIPGSPSSNNVAGRSTSGGSIAPHCCVTAGRQVNTVHRFPAARGTPPGSMAPVPMASRVLHLFYICAVRLHPDPDRVQTLLHSDPFVFGPRAGLLGRAVAGHRQTRRVSRRGYSRMPRTPMQGCIGVLVRHGARSGVTSRA